MMHGIITMGPKFRDYLILVSLAEAVINGMLDVLVAIEKPMVEV